MNDQSTKKINFNKSILLSLKAEVLKKQEEVIEKKQLPQHKVETFKPKAEKKCDVKKRNHKTFKDNLKAVDIEELETLRKSKLALEKKAELYEHLSDKTGSSQLAERFLVDFKGKKERETETPIKKRDEKETVVYSDTDDDNEWIEFTDCLGRTRKCLKSDLELYKKRDKELLRAITNDQQRDEPREQEPEKIPEKPFLVQKTNDYLQSLREKWEQKEKELLEKEKDIHYQDLLFDEARIHGVGYYSFSTDEAERKKQMEELIKQRQETLRAQKEAEERKKQRDELMAARVAAARARQRARAGLPPEEPQKNEKDFTTCLLEFLTQQRNEADAEAKEEEMRIREEQEKERQKLRESYVREWDIGKNGMEEKVKKFRELTQEEYVEQQRAKRIDEFAPPQQSSREGRRSNKFDEKGNAFSSDTDAAPKTWADVRPRTPPPPPVIGPIEEESPKGLFFTTKKANVKYKNFVKATEPTSIENELSDDENCAEGNERPEKRKSEGNSTEVPPPPTYDYYGPVPKHSKSNKPFHSDLGEAYSQGAKSLEPKASNRQLPKHYDFTFD